jgi:small conductance mechanosensitive channel
MNPELTAQVDTLLRAYVVPMAWKLVGALAVWILGGWAIRLVRTAFGRFMRSRRVDPTLARYLDSSVAILLNVLILIAVLGVLGIETTSFAALLAAAGIAIGAAWSGLLANFAAGLFLLTFRPFRVGDVISAAGVLGRVREIGLFVTSIDTPDHVLTFVANNKLFADNVQNFSANPFRRVDLIAQLSNSMDLERTVRTLRERVKHIPNVLEMPAPTIDILTFNGTGPVLTVRPCCRNDDYWQVYFDTNKAISQVCYAAAA